MNKHHGNSDDHEVVAPDVHPEKVETPDEYGTKGYTKDYANATEPDADYEAEECVEVAEKVLPIPADELPDAASDEDEVPPPSPPVSV